MRARRVLAEAMDVCDRNDTPVPCKANPVLWSDENATKDARVEMARRCRKYCPVLAECTAFLKACELEKVNLNGVVAGVTLREGKRVEQPVKRVQKRRDPNKLGTTTVEHAVELMRAGRSISYVAGFAGVTERTIYRLVVCHLKQRSGVA